MKGIKRGKKLAHKTIEIPNLTLAHSINQPQDLNKHRNAYHNNFDGIWQNVH